MFGTSQEVAEKVLAGHQEALQRLGKATLGHDASVDREAIVTELTRAGDFAYVDSALVGYFEDGGMKFYLTLDVSSRRTQRAA